MQLPLTPSAPRQDREGKNILDSPTLTGVGLAPEPEPVPAPAPWEAEPYRLWSLLDVMMVTAHRLVDVCSRLRVLGTTEMVTRDRNEVRQLLRELSDVLARLPDPLPGIAGDVAHLRWRMQPSGETIPSSVLQEAIDGILRQTERGLRRHLFFCIPGDQRELIESQAVFGTAVSKKIPDAGPDVAAAARCIAKDEPTASVFHSMRAAEHGLRVFARHLRVKVTHKKKPCRIEDAEWHKVIVACRNKLDKARETARGERRKSQLAKLADLADRCDYMREIWRNDISHAGKPYSPHVAQEVFERTKAFAQGVADAVGGKS